MKFKNKIAQFLWVNKEGAICGTVYGILSLLASLGIGTLPSVALWMKFVIAPVWIAGMFLPSDVSGGVAVAVTILIGAGLGVVIDVFYKPKE